MYQCISCHVKYHQRDIIFWWKRALKGNYIGNSLEIAGAGIKIIAIFSTMWIQIWVFRGIPDNILVMLVPGKQEFLQN